MVAARVLGPARLAAAARSEFQAADRARVTDSWQDGNLVFTTTLGTPYEPRNFARHFALRCCTKIRNGQLRDRNRPLSWVGDTGIEPVTSSV